MGRPPSLERWGTLPSCKRWIKKTASKRGKIKRDRLRKQERNGEGDMLSKGKKGEEIEAREREGKELRHVEGMMESQGKRKENEELHDRVGREGKFFPELFSIELHHGREISYDMYVGGKVTYIDNCDKDLMSLPVISDIVEAVGYIERFMNYYFKIPNMNLSNGLKQIQSDFDVQSMFNFVPKDKVIEMYIEELTTEKAKEKNCEGPKKSQGKSVADVGENDTKGDVGEGDVGEGNTEVFFDVLISLEGNVEEENEEATEEDDSDFEESEYGSDADNPVFSKFDERDYEQRSVRQSEQSREREEEQREEEFDTANMEQNVIDDLDYNSDALESVHSSDDERGKEHERFPEFNKKTYPTLTLGACFQGSCPIQASCHHVLASEWIWRNPFS
ncbi:uncharacterized protein LOC125468709 [Pyrus x bretschneideri]|uniref:uncharacterized protein LOC125468709 n=1 Tax=Pyrus x bretschneideri TaxID=225117 RepID=UPI00202F137A|nr:uncharacterized protein LOC125468709 [Pyrus x bretschneideri]